MILIVSKASLLLLRGKRVGFPRPKLMYYLTMKRPRHSTRSAHEQINYSSSWSPPITPGAPQS